MDHMPSLHKPSVLLFLICVASMTSLPQAWSTRSWDPYTNITGQLQDKTIEIAASSNEDGSSTDSLSWTGSDEDRWIDAEEEIPDDAGYDYDSWGAWDAIKCWWTATEGSVTHSSFTTTWTAPLEAGCISYLEIAVVDLPKGPGPGETGSRDDDGRQYFGQTEA
jgi:hypothetical protein